MNKIVVSSLSLQRWIESAISTECKTICILKSDESLNALEGKEDADNNRLSIFCKSDQQHLFDAEKWRKVASILKLMSEQPIRLEIGDRMIIVDQAEINFSL